jgi:hypothetical protein
MQGLAMAALLVLGGSPAGAATQIFLDAPTLEFDGGSRITVRWTSQDSLPPGRVAYGIQMLEDPYREPRFRMASREQGDADRRDHEASLRLDWLLSPRVDAAMQGVHRGGVVRARLELYHPRRRKLEYRYFRFAYSVEGETWHRLPCISSGPWLDRVAPDSAWLSWELDLPAELRLRYGPAEIDPADWQERILWCEGHGEVELTGLDPETRYAYTLMPVSEEGRQLPPRRWEFTSAPPVGAWPASGHLRVAFLGDGRGGTAGAVQAVEGTNRKLIRRLLVQAERAGADLICFGGDLIDGYTTSAGHYSDQLAAWKQAAECVGPRLPIYEGMGNHEMLADDFNDPERDLKGAYRDRAGAENSESLFAAAFVCPENGPPPPEGNEAKPFRESVYSFDHGPVHITALNNTYDVSSHPDRIGGYREGWLPQEQIDWLDADLTAARDAGQQAIFVFLHEPAFPCGGHVGDGMYWNGRLPEVLAMRDRFWNVLMKHRVGVTGFGDEHNYSRLRVDTRVDPSYTVPIWQIISGGVGAPFYAKDTEAPWAEDVAAFSAVQHFCIFDYSAAGVEIEVYDSFGRLMDRAQLD